MTNDDYLGEIDDDHHTINGPSAGTASIDVLFKQDSPAEKEL